MFFFTALGGGYACSCPLHQATFGKYGKFRDGTYVWSECDDFPSDEATFEVTVQSVNNDNYEVAIGWCADKYPGDDDRDCVFKTISSYDDNFKHTLRKSNDNYKYKQNVPAIRLKEHNAFDDAQIELSARIYTN